MKLRDIVPATELFATFRQRILTRDTNAEAMIRELCADAAIMRSFDDLGGRYSFFTQLPALDANIVLPIALLLFRSDQLPEERRQRALKILESWLARRALTRLTAKNYNRQVPRLIDKMSADLERADTALFDALAGSEGEISRWPTDVDLLRFLITTDAYGVVSKPRLVMALSAVEARFDSTKSDVRVIPAALTVEHIMPQDWEEHWDDLGDLDGNEREEAVGRREAHIHKIGNLTMSPAD